jgi:hypothetical protein
VQPPAPPAPPSPPPAPPVETAPVTADAAPPGYEQIWPMLTEEQKTAVRAQTQTAAPQQPVPAVVGAGQVPPPPPLPV